VNGFTSESAARTAYDAAYTEAPDKADCGYPREAYQKNGKWRWGTSTKNYKTKAEAEAARLKSTEYKNAENKYNSAVEKYNQYQATEKQYQGDVETYEQAKKDYADYEKDYNEKSAAYEAYMKWLEQAQGGTLVTDLTLSTKTASGQTVVSQRVEKVEMPDISNKQKYIEYCQNWTNTVNGGAKGGRLTCLNRYYGSVTREENGRTKTVTVDERLTVTNETALSVAWKATGKALIGSSSLSRGTLLDTTYETDSSKCPPARTLSEIRITGGYSASLQPFVSSGSTAYTAAEGIEKGSVILIGTLKYPIEIDGPVFIGGDVVIRGFVKGQGTIYAGRNIHIIGDISYLNAPSWPHGTTELTMPAYAPEEVRKSNATRDLLGLYARGNIIIGDYTSEDWTADSNMKYMKSYWSQSLACDTSLDSDIGYSTDFERDYTQNDGQKRVGWSQTLVETINNGDRADLKYFSGKGTFYYYREKFAQKSVEADCKFYESKFGSEVITELKQSSSGAAGSGQSTSWLKQLICRLLGVFGIYEGQSDVSGTTAIDAGDVTELDAVLFANHGIFGVVGGKSTHRFRLNGAMICRDEGVLPSFSSRFASDSAARIWLNWDMRVKSDSAEGNSIVGVTPDSESQSDTILIPEIYVSDWRQVE